MSGERLRPDDIESITMHCSTMAHRHCAWPYVPQGVTAAQMSLFYTLAAMAFDGEVMTEQFSESRLADPARLAFMKRIRIEPDRAYDAGGDASRHESRMLVTTRDARRFERHTRHRKGSPQNPMTLVERHAKFRRLAGAVLPSSSVASLISEVESLEQSNLRSLIQLLAKNGGSAA